MELHLARAPGASGKLADPVIPAIELAVVSVKRADRDVVHDISTAVASGRWLGIIGANGSGKTTLLRAIAGRLPIAAGRCSVEGRDVTDDRSARAKTVGFAPPIERLPSLLTVRRLLELAGDTIEVQEARNSELWVALEIAKLLDRPIGECSSGMCQRAAIALAFAAPTSIVILDEPFNWLDPVAAFDARSALAAKVRSGMTLLTAFHDLSTLCAACDEGIIMADGRISLELDQSRLRAGARDIDAFEHEMIEALRT